MPTLQFCRPDELRIDPAYQRGAEEANSATLIRRIAQTWNWDLCQPLVVARRSDLTERLFVIDGQHRLMAARLRGDIEQLPCVIVTYGSVAEEAAAFVQLNQQRKPLTRLDLFRAAVASGDAQASAIVAALTEAGLSLAPHGNYTAWKPGMVSHIGGIERSWTRDGPEVAGRALVALGHGFAGQVLRYGGTIYRGIARVCRDEMREHGGFAGERFERFLLMLQCRPQDEWMQEINRFFADNPDMFRAESAEALLRQEWRRVTDRAEPHSPLSPPRRNGGEPALPAKAAGFGLGASDWQGDAAWAWCKQCDARRTQVQAEACVSRFCSLRKVGADG
jgi:hypothetical protein